MSSNLKKFILIITILIRIRISLQLNFAQEQIKNKLITSTENLDPKMRVQFADYLKTFIESAPAPMIPKFIVTMINEVLDEYKSECLNNSEKKLGSKSQMPNLMDVEYIYGNIFADKVQQRLTPEELNHFMKSVNEDQQSSKISAARYLTIHLEKELKKVSEQFAKQLEKVIDKLATDTINHLNDEHK